MFTKRPQYSKYHSEKVTVDNIVFDSKLEAERYRHLKLLQQQGIIKDLKLQVPFELQPSFKKRGKTIRAITYLADFTYVQDGVLVVLDVKGYNKDKVYLIKKKLFEYKYPTLTLIEIGDGRNGMGRKVRIVRKGEQIPLQVANKKVLQL